MFRQRGILSHSDNSYYVTHVQDRAFNAFRYHIDSDAVNTLGWNRKYSDFDSALEASVEWYLSSCKSVHWGNIDRALAPHPHFTSKIAVASRMSKMRYGR